MEKSHGKHAALISKPNLRNMALQPDLKRRYTDVDLSCEMSSPGRFYIAVVIKTALAHMLREYDFRLADEGAPRTFSWRTTIVPRSSTKLLIRRREV
jgi:hypothetical protein